MEIVTVSYVYALYERYMDPNVNCSYSSSGNTNSHLQSFLSNSNKFFTEIHQQHNLIVLYFA